jgi:phenylacetate-CoA ligase
MDKLDRIHGFFNEVSETRSRKERLRSHNLQTIEIIAHAYEKCLATRDRFKKFNLTPYEIKGVTDLIKIPILRKDELVSLQGIKPPFGGLLGVSEEELSWIFMSPGPIYDPVTEADETRERSLAAAFYSCGFRKGDKVLNTWSYHMVPAGIYSDLALRYMGCTVIPAGIGNTELQVQISRHLKIEGFLGTAGFLMNILKKAEEMGLDPKKDLSFKVAIAGGEAGGGPMRRFFEEKYNMITGDFYGTSDVGVIAYECREKSGMHLIENIVVEIVDPETGKNLPPGEVGEVIVTNFNKVYPMIRFGTGDLSKIDDEYCACGRTSIRLTKILGRVGEAVRVRGMFVHLKQTQQVLDSFPELGSFQFIVSRVEYRDHLTLRVEMKEEMPDIGIVKKSLSEKFKDVCRLSPDEIIFLEPGKLANEKKVIIDQREY